MRVGQTGWERIGLTGFSDIFGGYSCSRQTEMGKEATPLIHVKPMSLFMQVDRALPSRKWFVNAKQSFKCKLQHFAANRPR